MARPGMRRADRWRAVVLLAVMLSSCTRSRAYKSQQEALYAAEAGLELAKMHLATVCKSAAAVADLRQRSTDVQVPLPGYEQPTNRVLNQTIHGSLSVRVRTVEQDPPMWLVVSTGQYGEAKEVVQARFGCADIQGPTAQ
jgi:hypothetical protein